jgi:hypothetical protein
VSAIAHPRRLRRRGGMLLPATLAVGVALTLAGCGRAGAAAIVDGRHISVTEVQDATQSLRSADPANFGKVTPSQVLSVLILGRYAEQAAAAAGQGVSDDVVRQALQSTAQQNGNSNIHLDRLNADAMTALRGEVALTELDQAGQQKVLQQIKSAHISVSPRYGTFNRTSGSITAATPNWIQPAAKPTAPASPSATG